MIKKLNIISLSYKLGRIIYNKIKASIQGTVLTLNNARVINNVLYLDQGKVENNKLILWRNRSGKSEEWVVIFLRELILRELLLRKITYL